MFWYARTHNVVVVVKSMTTHPWAPAVSAVTLIGLP